MTASAYHTRFPADEIIAAQKAEQKAAKAQQQQKQQQKAKAQQQKKDKASATARQPLKQQKNQHATNVTTAQHRPNKQSTAAQQKQSRVDQFSKNRPGLATHVCSGGGLEVFARILSMYDILRFALRARFTHATFRRPPTRTPRTSASHSPRTARKARERMQ